jgi:16S rRNA processing protein RimM
MSSQSIPRRVVLGRVRGAHGLRGQVRVRFFGDGPDSLARFPEVTLASSAEEPGVARHEVLKCSPGRAGEVRLTLSDLGDRDAAQALRGLLVLGEPEHLDALPPGDHYWYELVGCEVVDEQGRRLGRVRELWDTGAHDVLVVEREAGADVLVPAVDEWLRQVDPEGRRVVVHLLPGLIEPESAGG